MTCDCLNFCGDDPQVDKFSKDCVNYEERRANSLHWLIHNVPFWKPGAKYLQRVYLCPTGYIFRDELEEPTKRGFQFSFDEVNEARTKIHKEPLVDYIDVLSRAVEALGIIDESVGIHGYHLNGEILPWEESDLADLRNELASILHKEAQQ